MIFPISTVARIPILRACLAADRPYRHDDRRPAGSRLRLSRRGISSPLGIGRTAAHRVEAMPVSRMVQPKRPRGFGTARPGPRIRGACSVASSRKTESMTKSRPEAEDSIDPSAEELPPEISGLGVTEIRLNDDGQTEITEQFFPTSGDDDGPDVVHFGEDAAEDDEPKIPINSSPPICKNSSMSKPTIPIGRSRANRTTPRSPNRFGKWN